MGVNELYELAQYIINKNQSGYLSPDEFNLIINQAQTSYLDYLLGEFQQYQYQRSQARVQYTQNEITRQRLTPFIYGYNLSINNDGFSPYMGDYQQTDAIWTTYGFQKIKFVEQDKLMSYYNSRIDPISKNPIYLLVENGFQFYPQSLNSAKINYVKTPNRIWWGYTLDSNGIPVYNSSTSEDPKWYETDLLNILARALRMIGVNLQDMQVSQYAEEIKNNGQ